ncbi:hypothetical protein E8E12_009520 [Didymella heteroderae]|uniref:Uncharacterized protein n=1 Tax=Didymella heteroderae TaxID=1769908 RepID=A0A9P4WX88_9PLEO|nr:hypothetical protein E8E12_009520 [Didymella heteroderae]
MVLVGYACSEHSGHQHGFIYDAGKRNKEASSEADIPKDDQSTDLSAKTTSVEPGMIPPNAQRSSALSKKGKKAKKVKHLKRSTNADDGALDFGVPSNSRDPRTGVGQRNISKKKQVILQQIQDHKAARLQLAHDSKGVKAVKMARGTSKDILLALDESRPTKNPDNITSESDLEQRSLPIGVDQDLEISEPAEQQNPDLEYYHAPWTTRDSSIFDNSGPTRLEEGQDPISEDLLPDHGDNDAANKGIPFQTIVSLDGSQAMMPQSYKSESTSITTLSTRNLNRKADSRVIDIERKINALTAKLRARISVAPRISDQLLEGEDEDDASESSYAASVFSFATMASSVSNLSKYSNYSSKQIATATRELFEIFLRNLDLIELQQRAIADPEIGPERLQRNLRRFFQAYAKNLEDEHTERLEYLASRLVAMKARPLAESILEKYYCAPAEKPVEGRAEQDESSEDEAGSQPVDEKIFEDLKAFREFLTSASAFEIFRAQIRSFVIPRSQQVVLTDEATSGEMGSETPTHKGVKATTPTTTWRSWRAGFAEAVDILPINRDFRFAAKIAFFLAFDAFAFATDRVFIAIGVLEPLLSPKMVRMRWRCRCGDRLFSDAIELQENGVQELATRMEDSSGVKVAIAGYNLHSGNQQYNLPRRFAWFGRTNGACQTNQAANIPMYSSTSSASASTAACTSSQGPSAQKQMLHLMAYMHNKRSSKILQQDRIEDVATDCDLIRFLRRQYRKRRSRFRSFLSLKTVQGIHFVKSHLPMGNNVIIYPHGVSCTPLGSLPITTPTAMCECLPPRARVEPTDTAEYHCQPVPPKTFPPVPPEYLLSLFTCQEQSHQMSRWIVEQLRKRTWGELFGKPEQPAEGWGIYYREGWDTGLIAIVVFLLLFASLLFSILWATLKDDIQGAFGVGAWMVGIGGALLAVIVTQADGM